MLDGKIAPDGPHMVLSYTPQSFSQAIESFSCRKTVRERYQQSVVDG